MAEPKQTMNELRHLQSLSLDEKIVKSKQRIFEWYTHFHGQVYVSFSGGKDSTVLLHLVRQEFPDVPAVYSATPDFPEIREFVSKQENVITVEPNLPYFQIVKEYGYPVISKEVSEAIYYARRGGAAERERERESTPFGLGKETVNRRLTLLGKRPLERGENYWENLKAMVNMGDLPNTRCLYNKTRWLPLAQMPFKISHYCCYVMKKLPLQKWQRQNKRYPILGSTTEESNLRTQSWLRHGCNAFDNKKKVSIPLAFWKEQDILQYIKRYDLEICSAYGDLIECDNKLCYSKCQRTGCIGCAFGMTQRGDRDRFLKLKETHPKQYDWLIRGGQWVDKPEYDPTLTDEPDILGWVPWNPKKIWTPGNGGLGLGKVFDVINEVYGEGYIPY